MITFTVVVEECDDEGRPTGHELQREFTWPLPPRIGESLAVGGNQYDVVGVTHNIDREPPTIEVITRWSAFDFVMLSKDERWRRVFM